MDKEPEILKFWGYSEGKKLGIQDKLAWFYNSFGDDAKINLSGVPSSEKKDLKKQLYVRLRDNFPGFQEIYDFRNDISHGKIDPSAANLSNAEALRKQAKSIVDELFKLAEQAGYSISRTKSYYEAIASDTEALWHKGWLTMRAPDLGYAPRFLGIFLALGLSPFRRRVHAPTPSG